MHEDQDAQGQRLAHAQGLRALTAGLGLKAEHYDEALACRAEGLWFEVHAENHSVEGGPRRVWLERLRADHPLSLHGVSLSLAGARPIDGVALARLAALVRQVEPALVSEHLAWSRQGGAYLPDLLPFPRGDEALRLVAAHVDQVQEALGRTIAIENPAHYLRIDGHDFEEIEFLAELARRTGCSLLLDIANVYVSARNVGVSAERYIDAFPAERVSEIHLAGHRPDARLGDLLLVDSHDAPVAAPVWTLFQRFVERAGPRPTLIERDAELPPFAELLAERAIAHARLAGLAPGAA